MNTIKVHVCDFCEYCGKSRRVSLVQVGQWFIWYCFPCQVKRAIRNLFE